MENIFDFVFNISDKIDRFLSIPLILLLKFLIGLFCIGSIVLIIYSLIGAEFFRTKWNDFHIFWFESKYSKHQRKDIIKRWKSIVEMAQQNNFKNAIIQADNLTNEILAQAGRLGSTLSEKLENISTTQMPDITNILSAHELAQKLLLDETNEIKLNKESAIKTLLVYEKLLKDQGFLG